MHILDWDTHDVLNFELSRGTGRHVCVLENYISQQNTLNSHMPGLDEVGCDLNLWQSVKDGLGPPKMLPWLPYSLRHGMPNEKVKREREKTKDEENSTVKFPVEKLVQSEGCGSVWGCRVEYWWGSCSCYGGLTGPDTMKSNLNQPCTVGETPEWRDLTHMFACAHLLLFLSWKKKSVWYTGLNSLIFWVCDYEKKR